MSTTLELSKVVQIVSGNFSGTEKTEGERQRQNNFTGYDVEGESYFIARKRMESIGINKDDEFKPFFIIVTKKTFNVLDESNQPILNEDGTPQTFDRTQASACFATSDEASDAVLASEMLKKQQADKLESFDEELKQKRALKRLELTVKLKKQAEEMELAPETVNQLINIF